MIDTFALITQLPLPIYPLALATIILLLLLQSGQSFQRILLTSIGFIAALLLGYLLVVFTPNQLALPAEAYLLIALVLYALLLIFGLYCAYRFFLAKGVAFKPDITSGAKRLESLRQKRLPLWVFVASGFMVSILEPLRLQASPQWRVQEVLLTTDMGALLSILGLVMLAATPLMVVVGLYALISNSIKKKPSRKPIAFLLLSVALISMSWLLVMLTSGFLLL